MIQGLPQFKNFSYLAIVCAAWKIMVKPMYATYESQILYVPAATSNKIPIIIVDTANIASPMTGQFSLSFPTPNAANAPVTMPSNKIKKNML